MNTQKLSQLKNIITLQSLGEGDSSDKGLTILPESSENQSSPSIPKHVNRLTPKSKASKNQQLNEMIQLKLSSLAHEGRI